jgi:transcriptional regulator with XRE-family HTH domain
MKTKLQLLREHLQLSQQELSKDTGIAQPTISLFETGSRNLSVKAIQRLIKVMLKKYDIQLSADDFITNIYVDQEFKDYLKSNAGQN